MSATEPQAGSPALATMLFEAMKRLGSSVLPFVVVILIWQFASLFFPRFLFPSLIDVFWRCLEIFSSGAMFACSCGGLGALYSAGIGMSWGTASMCRSMGTLCSAAISAKRNRKSAEAAATRVDFYTLVRGEG